MNGLQHYHKRKYLNVSSLVAFARCPRRYFYSAGCKLGETHAALNFGTAIHAALGPALTKGYEAGMVEFDKNWDGSQDDDKRNRKRAMLMLLSFINAHLPGMSIYNLLPPPINNPLKKNTDRVSEYEIPFALDIGLDVPLVGRIDGWATHRDNPDQAWAVEYKTSSELSTRFLSSFTLNPQTSIYTMALKAMIDKPVAGCMVEGLLVTKGLNTNTLVNPVYVQSHVVEAAIKWAQYYGKLILDCEKLGEFPQMYSGCNSYSMFGSPGYNCDFIRLCQVPEWTMLKDMYPTKTEPDFYEEYFQLTLKGNEIVSK